MFFLPDYKLFYVHENRKSKKVHGTFGLGWKYQRRIVFGDTDDSEKILMDKWPTAMQ